jgi:hypothetical protein
MNQSTIPCRKRWRRLFARFCGVIVALAVFVYFTRGFWITTIRSYCIGRVYVAAQDYGRFLPAVDEVEILALGAEVPKGTSDSFPTDFGASLGTVNRQTIRGAEAEEIADLWRGIEFSDHFAGLCHQPFYAIRFRRHGKLILETSVCWKCSTYTLPIFFGAVPYGFDSKSDKAQELLAMLTRYAPHPQTTE